MLFPKVLPSSGSAGGVGLAGFRVEDLNQIGATSLRVGYDTTGIYVTQAGIARYVRGLRRGIEQVSPSDVSIFPLGWEVESFAYKQPQRAIRTAYRELVWGKFVAPGLLRENGADLLHSTSSLFIRCPRNVHHVVTLHDLSISRHPERFRSWQVHSWHKRLNVIRRADRVICISQFTADEAVQLLDLPAGKIEVIHNGCDWHDTEIKFQEAAPDIELPGEFFLFVGSLEPGKNLKLLREAYFHAMIKGRRLPPLLIVGARREGVAHEGEQPRGWHYLGRPSDAQLLYLYRRALALLFPSRYEGFGLPVVEAMAQGCPVICSPVSSLPEVAGDAALMTDLSAARYVDAMRELLRKPDLRKDLIARGRKRAAHFSWRRCAQETLSVYRAVQNGAQAR